MDKSKEQLFVEISLELNEVNQRISDYHDKGDDASVEHLMEQQTYLNEELAELKSQLPYNFNVLC